MFRCTPFRLWIAVMIFWVTFINFTIRVSFSINLLAMVKPTGETNQDEPNYGPRYAWTEKEQANLLGAFFYGYIVLSIAGGMLAEFIGGRIVVGSSLIVLGILNALIPLAAQYGVTMVFVVRFFTGVFSGITYPACHNLIAQWAPHEEKGRFVASLTGGSIGIVLSIPISAVLVKNCGWNWAFYVVTIFSFIICVMWFLITADKPAKSKFISNREKEYIVNSLSYVLSRKKKYPPFRHIFTSLPFIALIFLHYGNLWGLSFLITSAPKYLSEVLELSIYDAGIAISLPYLSRILVAFMFGVAVDIVKSRHYLIRGTLLRKLFCICSHIFPGFFLNILAAPALGKNLHYCLLMLSFTLGFNGAATATNILNSQDLAPNYAGTLYGIMNCIGMTSGFLSPLVVASFTSDENTFDQWKYVFIITGWMYIITALIFIYFGTAKVQFWNFDSYNSINIEPIQESEINIVEKKEPSRGGFKKQKIGPKADNEIDKKKGSPSTLLKNKYTGSIEKNEINTAEKKGSPRKQFKNKNIDPMEDSDSEFDMVEKKEPRVFKKK